MVATLELRRPQNPTAALLGTMLVIGSLGLGGCASQNVPVAEAALRQPSPAIEQASFERSATADFEIVDCELPREIRRLGVELVYLGPARQIRTTTRDCVLRGGTIGVHHGPDEATWKLVG